MVWLGRESGGGRFAVHVESGERISASPPPESRTDPGKYLFDCDPAAVRAHATGTLCTRHGLAPLGDSNGYLTGDQPSASPWFRAYAVVYHGAGDRKSTQAALNCLGGGVTAVKTRGVKEPADTIRARFKPAGDRALTLTVWPVGKSLRHALIEPV